MQFDPTGEPDKLDALLDKATQGALTAGEATRLREALRVKEPTLEWAGKREQREKGFLEVDPVALHIHERVSAQAILKARCYPCHGEGGSNEGGFNYVLNPKRLTRDRL